MPAKENAAAVIQLSDAEATTKLIRKDVDKLVQNIKDNLKLSYEAVHEKATESRPPPSSFPDYLAPTAMLEQQQRHPPPPQLGAAGGSRKARSYMSSKGSSRASPYAVPTGSKCDCDESGRPASWAARKRYPSMSAAGKPKIELDDPLEMLQELIRLALDFHTLLFCRPLLSGRLFLAAETPWRGVGG
jgi:hypothetical protein